MKTFFNRLTQIIEYQGFKSLNDFALNGLNYDSSSKLNRLKDENKSPSFEILIDISNKFQTINIHWLVTGNGKMVLNNEEIATNILQEPKEIYNKNISSINDNYSLLQQNNSIKDELIGLLKEKLSITEKKLVECQKQKNILQDH